MKKRTNLGVYLLCLALVLSTAGIIYFKITTGGEKVIASKERALWRVSSVINIAGTGETARFRLYLPHNTRRQAIYNSHFDNDGLDFTLEERYPTGNTRGVWRSMALDGLRQIQCDFSVRIMNVPYNLPKDLKLPEHPLEAYPEDVQFWLGQSNQIQSKDDLIAKKCKEIIGKEKKVVAIVEKIYKFVREEVTYKSEKGSRDARKTLDELTADCGGKARLFVAMSRAVGIPSRVVGGIILDNKVKRVTHVWVENYIAGEWVPFDVVNGHFAYLPNDYMEVYRGDIPLFKHKGLSSIEWVFIIGPANIPPIDNVWSLYVLPEHLNNMLNILLLIPFGALVTAFLRNVVGLQTFGTFSPMLLALAFCEVTMGFGLLIFLVIFFMGWLLRKALDALKILFIPKLSIILSATVIMVLLIMMVGFNLGVKRMYYVSIFPLVIISWIIERFTISQLEDGTIPALKLGFSTLLTAVILYYFMNLHILRLYLFAFPELILAMIGGLLLIGRYTGLRLTEVLRFKELYKRP